MIQPTVTEIVQKLLDKGYINAEQALILLKAEIHSNNPIITYPQQICPENPNPYNQPYYPVVYPTTYPQIWCGTTSNNITSSNLGLRKDSGLKETLNDNFTQK